MNKRTLRDTVLAFIGVLSIMTYSGIQFLTGYDPNGFVSCILFLISSISFQLLFWRIVYHPALKLLPLILTVLITAWGCWLYCTSPSWTNAGLSDLLIWYVSPLVGCLAAVGWSAWQ